MEDPLLVGFAEGLAAERIACLRFNFPYRELGKRAPDPEAVLRRTWEAAFELGTKSGSPVWAGGKSLGGRIDPKIATIQERYSTKEGITTTLIDLLVLKIEVLLEGN